MTADVRSYPRMKDSGVPWMGEVPEHWRTERAKWLFRKMNRPVRESDEVVTCFRDGTVTLRKNRRVRGFTESLKEIGYQGIRRGDLVIHAMDAFAGAVGVADVDGKGTPVYSVCEPRTAVDSHYYAYAIREMARSQWIQALAKGIRERSTDFRFEGFGSQLVPLPPLPEQTAVVRFLDHADWRIHHYIRAKQKLIKLLEEQRQAIIYRAVTRGLDSKVRLKSSGVEWLGELPAHWSVLALRRLTSFVTSGSRGWAEYYSDEGDLFIQSGNLGRSMSLDFSYTQHVRPPQGAEGERTRVRRNDVLICITGALTGNVVIVDSDLPRPAYVNQHLALVRLKPGSIDSRFLAYALHSELGRIQFKNSEYGGTKQGLGLDDIKSAVVPVPPADEQARICAELDETLRLVISASAALHRELVSIREFWTRLMADGVTGKLDVRDAAARLPEEIGELQLREDDESAHEMDEGEDAVSEEAEA